MRISKKVNAMLFAAAAVGLTRGAWANSTDTWTGAAGDVGTPYSAGTAIWNTTAANWSDSSGGTTYTVGDNVVFTDNFVGDTSIALGSGNLNPVVMEFSHIAGSVGDTYTFLPSNGTATSSTPFGAAPAGGALPPQQLILDSGFMGRVILQVRSSGSNTFRSQTTVNGGTLEIDDAGALPGFTTASGANPTINLGGGTLAININLPGNNNFQPASSQLLGLLNVSANSTIELDTATIPPGDGSHTYDGQVNFVNPSTLFFNSVIGNEMDYAPLFYTGRGTISLGATNTALELTSNPVTNAQIAFDLGSGAGILHNNAGNNLTETLGALTGGVNTVLEGSETANDATTYIIGGAGSSTFNGIIRNNATGSAVGINKGGLASTTLTLTNPSSSYTGATTVSIGTLAATSAGGTPFGVGNLIVAGGNLNFAPSGSGSAVAFTAASAGPTNQVTFSGSGTISLNRSAQTSVTVTVGDPVGTPGSAVFARVNQGTLIIAPAGGTSASNLGVNEILNINPTTTGNLPVVTNGIVDTAMVGQDSDSGKSGDFLTYNNTSGFVLGTYGDTNFAAPSSTTVENVTAPVVALGSSNVFAIKAGANIDIGPLAALTVGNPGTSTAQQSNQAGVILNGASITSAAGTGTLAFGGAEGTIYTSAAGGTISAAITGTGGVTFFGPGTIKLAASNSYTGTTALNGGIINFSAGNNFGGTGSIQFNGAELQFAPGNTTDITALNNPGTATTVTINTSGGTLDLGGQTVSFANNVNGGTGGLTIQNGVLITSAANGYNGVTTIAGNGTLQLGNGGTVGSIGGTINDNGALIVNRSDALGFTFGNAILGTGTLTVAGPGTVALSGTNTYSGLTTINPGATLDIGGNNNGGKTGQVLGAIVDNGQLNLNRSDTNLVQGGTITGTGAVATIGGGTVALTADSTYSGGTTLNLGSLILGQNGTTGSVVGPILDNANLTLDRSDALYNFTNVLSGTGSFTTIGTGTIAMVGSNSYTGPTNVALGTLRLTNASSLGASGDNLSVNGGLLDLNGISLNVGVFTGSSGVVDNLTAGGAVSITVAGQAANASTTTVTVASVLRNSSGSLALVDNNPGTLVLSGSNTNTGGITVNAGTLRIGKNSSLGASSNPFVDNSLLDLNSFSPSIGNFSGTGVIDNVSSTVNATMTFTGGGSGNTTFSGIIQNTVGTVSFAKSGSGTLTLTGSNTYGGTTSVNSGNLVIGTHAALPAGPIVVGNGTASATMTLSSNTGAFTETSITVNTNGTLDVGNNKIVLNYGSAADPVTAIEAELTSGHNGGTWTGTGISSSVAAQNPSEFAVGYLDGNRLSDEIGGHVAANQILISYTLAGDAFLEGSVGFDDLVSVAQNFGKTGQDWSQGNFIYDPNGSVGFADLVNVAQNFGRTSGVSQGTGGGGLSPAWQTATVAQSAVPEPGTFALTIGAAGLLARRRRAKR